MNWVLATPCQRGQSRRLWGILEASKIDFWVFSEDENVQSA